MSYNTKRSKKWKSGIFICIVIIANDEFVGAGAREPEAGKSEPNSKTVGLCASVDQL
jgi:hypothetical protein